jgi:hypothetical protein
MSTNGHSAASSRTTAHVATHAGRKDPRHPNNEGPPTAAEALATPDQRDTAGRVSELKGQYLRFHPLALALPADQVRRLEADPLVILRNVRIGVDAVQPMIDRIKAELPAVGVDPLLELPAVAGGLVYANTLVRPATSGEIRKVQARVKPIRKEALSAAEVFVRRGLLPAERVQEIKQLAPPIRTALKTAALADLFVEFWERLAGKHALTQEEITQLGVDGDWLAKNLTPKGARKEKAAVLQVAPREVRNRFYGLVVKRHSELRRVAAYFWGAKEADRRVPKLTSLVVGSRSVAASTDATAQAPATPTPVEPTAPTAPAAMPPAA